MSWAPGRPRPPGPGAGGHQVRHRPQRRRPVTPYPRCPGLRAPYSPLGRGFLTGALDRSALGEKDFRRTNPRFADEANEKIARTVREVADRLGATPAQVALAWVYAQAERLGVAVAAIPGTRSPARPEQNAAALELTLDAEALAALDPLSDQVRGERYTPAHTAEVARG
ncbi:aldo/keto reductase [Streptomyces spinosirectus]|uniref:aldo/keto reductase n=1 Tax=Streptomyces TaxID=1883 RepID=UPI001F308F32|nr:MULTISPECIES: aldo/keto reductase [Streptomyces]UIR19020.1 aldo/keto reductase [Streptomyces spinosirectus]